MKVKVSELQGAALDWAVAKCEGVQAEYINDGITRCLLRLSPFTGRYSPSTNWGQGGPIIEREKLDLLTEKNTPESWVASVARYQNGERLTGWRIHQYGPTPLIAAMRCYVASKFGDTVDVPNELME